MDKDVAQRHSEILLSYRKECIWVSSNEVDEPGAYDTEGEGQKEKDKYCVLTHM